MTYVIPTGPAANGDDMWATMPDAMPTAPRLMRPDENPLAGTPEGDEYAAQENASRLAAYDQAISEQIERRELREYIGFRAREQAQRRVADEAGDRVDVPPGASLTTLLQKERPPTRWLIEGVWRRGGVILFIAQAKAGKTTARDNVIRSLVDGDRFLGVHKVVDADDLRVGVLDLELDEDEFIDWLATQRIRNTDRVWCWTMRGKAQLLDLRLERVRQRWVEQIRAQELRVLIVDCLSPILSALGIAENDNQQVGQVLDWLLAISSEAGVRELLVLHHMGHGAERARGASRLRGWPDAEWTLVREKPDDPLAEPDPDAPRYFAAYGRKVSVPQGKLVFDAGSHRLTYVGGSRQQVAVMTALTVVLRYVDQHPMANGGQIESGIAASKVLSRDSARDARKAALVKGLIEEVRGVGPTSSKGHVLTAQGRLKLAELTMSPVDPDDPFDAEPDGEERYCEVCTAYILPADAALGAVLCVPCGKAGRGGRAA